MRGFTVAALAAAWLAALAPGVAEGRSAQARYLWATINICDTPTHPNEMGVRASMPGNGRRQGMFMRFHAQFYDPARNAYREVAGVGRSPWIRAGSARFRYRQAGFTFVFDPPAAGTSFKLRGLVEVEWRERRRTRSGRLRTVVVRRAVRVTRGGRKGVRGGDPPGYSAGSCEIR